MGEYRLHQKLVRDKIPQNLIARGIKVIYSRIKDFFRRDQLSRDKLVEEALELQKAQTREEKLAEAADVAEVFEAFLRVNKITPEELAEARAKKIEKNGGFEEFYYLESTEEPDEPLKQAA